MAAPKASGFEVRMPSGLKVTVRSLSDVVELERRLGGAARPQGRLKNDPETEKGMIDAFASPAPGSLPSALKAISAAGADGILSGVLAQSLGMADSRGLGSIGPNLARALKGSKIDPKEVFTKRKTAEGTKWTPEKRMGEALSLLGAS